MKRLLAPRSVAVIGGGGWCANVLRELDRIGFDGPIWHVHPTRAGAFASVDDLPEAPDAAFVGVNRAAAVEVIGALARRGAGGAVCFASGFREAALELADGGDLQAALVAAAGDMPVLGPNCYGFVNALDRVALWPDQHGCVAVDSGVAILTQSSNIALNLTMQRRGLPIAYLGTVGNQAVVDLSRFGMALLEDPRVTALGLHIEGIADLRRFEALVARAFALGKRIVAVKAGASEQAQVAAVSHTASLAGSDAGARAFLRRCGVAQVSSLEALLEALKILHCTGPLANARLGSMSCSGGEASLMADSALGRDVVFPPLNDVQQGALRVALGPKVALSNPLDYHTYIWGDEAAVSETFSAMMTGSGYGLGLVVLDFPRADRCSDADWAHVVTATGAAARTSGVPMAVLSSLVDTLPENWAARIMAEGLVPLCGITAALEAVEVCAWLGAAEPGGPVLLPGTGGDGLWPEAEAKRALAAHGLAVPVGMRCATPEEAEQAAKGLGRVVVKGEGVAHKSEAGAIRLGLTPDEVLDAAQAMNAPGYLVEEQITGTVAELLIGVLRDPAHGFVLTLGAGGVLTELWADTVSALLPVSAQQAGTMLDGLRIGAVLAGYRGAPGADRAAIIDAVLAVQEFVVAHAATIDEVEVNPLLCLEDRAVAVDALIWGQQGEQECL